MRAAIYTRISRDDLGDGLGVERQEADCRTLCVQRGWSIVETYVDNDFSAFSGRVRPAYQRLVADMGSAKIDALVAWAPERLHRSPRELEDFLELLDRSGTVVETVKAGVWDVSTSHGRLVARMLGAVSRAESERTGERVSRAHQQAKERGLWRGPIPYGMRTSDTPGRPEPDPDQTAVVADIFRRVTRGDALTQIASDLNRRGVLPRRGKAWTHTGIDRLIASPALGGLVKVEDELRRAQFDGVVSPDEWRAAGASLRRRPRGETRRPRDKLTLLGGMLTCHEHGSRCYGGSAGSTGIYVAAVPGRCFVSMSRRGADEAITHVVLERLRARADRRV
jgi:site-specific DNA recombinase